jgi:hypothetical protein
MLETGKLKLKETGDPRDMTNDPYTFNGLIGRK